jgi:diguanylate cyclase (GGDEF)-like protein
LKTMFRLESILSIHVWLSPDHLVSTAKVLFEGHKLSVLAITDNNRKLLGVVKPGSIEEADPFLPLSGFIEPAGTSLHSGLSIRAAADAMLDAGRDWMPVMNGAKFQGILTLRDLVERLRQSWDPLTELPWSDALRDWASQKLATGQEITVLFVDLRAFKNFNSQFGHVVGDKVLKRVAKHLVDGTNPKTDLVVRYGGDEFAIGTTRERDEAETLRAALLADGKGLKTGNDTPNVLLDIGLYGGRRTKERKDVHSASTIDSLINLASKECLARKPAPEPESAPQPPASPGKTEVHHGETDIEDEYILAAVEAAASTSEPAFVVIRRNHQQEVGTCKIADALTHHADGAQEFTSELCVALATLEALQKFAPQPSFRVASIAVTHAGSAALVKLSAKRGEGDEAQAVSAESESNGDLNRTVAAVVLGAFFAQ